MTMSSLYAFGGLVTGYSLAMTSSDNANWGWGTFLGAAIMIIGAGIEVATRK